MERQRKKLEQLTAILPSEVDGLSNRNWPHRRGLLLRETEIGNRATFSFESQTFYYGLLLLLSYCGIVKQI